MAGTIQSYKIVFDFVAKGGDQAKTQIENLIKLANQAGQTNLADSLTKRSDRINEIYDQVVNRTITAKDAVKALDKTFAGAYRDIKGTDIYGAEQSKEAKKRIDELTKSIQEYDNKINAIKTAPSSAYNSGNTKFRTKVGPGNAREAYGTSKAAEKAGLDPNKYSIEGMMGKAFGDKVQGIDFTKITNLRDLYQQLTPTLGEFNKEQLDAYNRLGAFLENVNKASGASKEYKDSLKSEKEALVEEKTQLEATDAAYKQNKDAIDKLNEALKEHNLHINEEGKVTQLATEESTEHSKALDNEQKSRDKQIKATDNLIARYFTLRMAYQSIKRIMTEVYQVTKKLDDAFSEIAVVSTYTTKQVWDMYDSFLNIANITGTTSTEIIKVAGEYFKQGKSLSEALVLTEAAALSANVAGIDATESVKYLTAALNGYKLEATDALMVSDKFSKLAATSATDYADLAIALGKVAAQANASGVNMDSLLGFMTTALEVTQEAPENIGTAFKTIFARMSEIKDYGKVLEDNTTANQVSKALNTIGISLFDETTGQMRALDKVLFEVGERWDTLDTNQQKYITTALAGTRQQTRLISIFQDWDTTMKYVNASAESTGATLAQQAKKMDTITFAVNKLNNAWESFIKTLGGSEIITGVINTLTTLVNVLQPIAPLVALFAVGFMTVLGAGTIRNMVTASQLLTGLKATLKTGIDNIILFFMAFEEGSEKATNGLAKLKGGLKNINTVFKGLISWKTLIIAGIVAAAAAIIYFATMTERAKKRVAELYAEIYNRDENISKVQDLVKEFDELDKKIVKTTEDYQRLNSLREQISESASPTIFGLDGSIDMDLYDRWLEEQYNDQKKAYLEADKKINEMGGYGAAYSGSNADSYTRQQALEIKTIQALTNEYENLDKAVEEYYANKASYSAEDIRNAEKQAKLLLNLEKGVKYKTQETDKDATSNLEVTSTVTKTDTLKNVLKNAGNDEIKTWMDNQGLENWITSDQILPEVFNAEYLTDLKNKSEEAFAALKQIADMKNYISGLAISLMSQTDENGNPINSIRNMDDFNTWVDSLEVPIEKLENYIGRLQELAPNSELNQQQITDYITAMDSLENNVFGNELSTEEYDKQITGLIDQLQKAGIAGADAWKLIDSAMDDYFNKLFDWQNDLADGQAIIDSFDGIEEAFSNNDFGAAYENLYKLMEQYPEYQDIIADSIIETGNINEDVQRKIVEDQRTAIRQKLKDQAAVLDAEIKALDEELDSVKTMSVQEFANRVLTNEAILKDDAESADKAAIIDSLLAQHRVDTNNEAVNAANRYAEAVKNSSDGIITENYTAKDLRTDANIVSSQTQFGSGYGQAYQRIEAFKKEYTQAIESLKTKKEAQLKTINAMLAAVDNGTIDFFKYGSSSGKGSGSSKDTKEALEAYNAQLERLYNIEQKLSNLESKNSLLDALNEYYEKVGDGASQRSIALEQVKLYEQQIKLLNEKAKIIQSEKIIVSAALSKEAAAIAKVDLETGRLLIDYDKYSKANDKVKEEVDNFTDSFDELAESAEETSESIVEAKNAIEEYYNTLRDKTIEYQNQIKDAFIKYYQDLYQRQIDSLEKEKELLNKRKSLYQDAFSEQEYQNNIINMEQEREKILTQLAAVEGATDAKTKATKLDLLKKLEDANEKYNKAVVDHNKDALTQQIEDQSEALDSQKDNLQEIMDDIPNQVQMLEEAMNDLTSKGVEAVTAFLEKWTDSWKTSLTLERDKIKEEWTMLYDYLYGDTAQNAFIEYYTNLRKTAEDAYKAISIASGMAVTSGSTAASWHYNGGSYANYNDIVSLLGGDKAKADQLKAAGKIRYYKKGGYVDYTGLAMVHGTSSSPEAFLNSRQTAMFKNLTEVLERLYNNNSENINSSSNIQIDNITVQTNQLNSSQDWYAGGKQFAEGLQDILRQRGIVTNLKR